MEPPPPQINFANYPLKDIPSPHPHDVLCGRGGGTNNHVGNSHWRMLVAANKQLYVTLPKRQKMLLSRSIVNAVRSQNPPGRFLQKDAKSELWYDVGDQRAQEKTSQALREGAPDIRSKLAKGETVSTEEPTKPNTGAVVTPPAVASAPTPPNTTSQQQTVPAPAMMPATPNASFVPSSGPGVAPPGSTPVMVYTMPQGGMPGVPMYQAMVTPQGMVVPTMHSMPPPFPPPVPAQVPSKKSETASKESGEQEKNQYDVTKQQSAASGPGTQKPGGDLEEVGALMAGGLEPSGVSFGSISMTSVGNGKLEPAGTSFGSMMSFSVAGTRAPDMVDGGLEPIGTSFGSLSLNSVDRSHLQRALQPDMSDMKQAPKTFATPTLLSQQRSTGNLLECSDTESEDEEEEEAPNQASKSAEWEKLKAMLEAHTNMGKDQKDPGIVVPQPGQTVQFDAIPHTGFDRDFSNISAISMGEFEDFDTLSPVSEHQQQLNNYPGTLNDAAAMPPPPPMPTKEDDDDGVSERERLEMMYLAQGGGMNFAPQNTYGNGN